MMYKVLYNEVPIGVYNIISNKCVEYTVDKSAIDRLRKKGIKVIPIITNDYTGQSFPFFDNRIENSKKYENVSIGYNTDPVELVKVENVLD